MKRYLLVYILLLAISSVYSQKKKEFPSYPTNSNIVYGICFTQNGAAIGIADGNMIRVYSTENKELLNEFKNGHTNQILTIDISADSTLLVSGGKDSTIVIWDFINNRILETLTYHAGVVTSIEISRNGKYLISGGSDNMVYLYDLEEKSLRFAHSAHHDDVTSVKFSYDSKLAASSGGDKMIHIYDIESNTILSSLKGHTDWVRSIDFSSDHSRILSCGDDARVIIWDINNPKNPRKILDKKYGYNWLLTAAFHEEGKTYALAGVSGRIQFISPISNYNTKIGAPVNKILFQPNVSPFLVIVVATRGKGVLVIDAREL